MEFEACCCEDFVRVECEVGVEALGRVSSDVVSRVVIC